MIRIVIGLIMVVVVCITLCYTTNRVCTTFESSSNASSSEHSILRQDHETLLKVGLESKHKIDDNNQMLKYIYNMAKRSENADMKVSE